MHHYLRLAASLIVLLLFFSSCKKEGWQTSPSGLKYWIQKDEPGKTLVEGDIVEIHIKYATSEDSLIFSSFEGPKPIIMPIPRSPFKGSFEEGLTLLSPGDSAQFMVPVDSLFKPENGIRRPNFIDTGSYLTFTVKILSGGSKEEFMKMQEKKKQETSKNQMEVDEKLIAAYIKEKGLNTTKTDQGVYIQIMKEGQGGALERGDSVYVHYTGRTLDGTIFDSSRGEEGGRGTPFDFVLGVSPIIPGWQDGIGKLQLGSKAILIIPSTLAYGEQSTPRFGPNSVLTFDVEIMKVVKSKK